MRLLDNHSVFTKFVAMNGYRKSEGNAVEVYGKSKQLLEILNKTPQEIFIKISYKKYGKGELFESIKSQLEKRIEKAMFYRINQCLDKIGKYNYYDGWCIMMGMKIN